MSVTLRDETIEEDAYGRKGRNGHFMPAYTEKKDELIETIGHLQMSCAQLKVTSADAAQRRPFGHISLIAPPGVTAPASLKSNTPIYIDLVHNSICMLVGLQSIVIVVVVERVGRPNCSTTNRASC